MMEKMRQGMGYSTHQRGFTIVELLIVVVVIAVLAAVTIVAYNGIQNQAREGAARSVTAQIMKKIAAYAIVNNENFPASLSVSGLDIPSGSATYEYRVGDGGKSYCLTATQQGVSYYVSNRMTSPEKGGCPGHSTDGVAAITNWAINPSFEANSVGTGYMGGVGTDSNAERTGAWSASGSLSIKITKTGVTNRNAKGVRMAIDRELGEGDIVRWSAIVRNSDANPGSRVFNAYGERTTPSYAGYSSTVSGITLAPGESGRVIGEVVVASSHVASVGATGFGVIPALDQFQTGDSYFVDSFFITVNEPLPDSYYDGSSAHWYWNGAQYNSTSVGVPF